jgi:hypothetical protein
MGHVGHVSNSTTRSHHTIPPPHKTKIHQMKRVKTKLAFMLLAIVFFSVGCNQKKSEAEIVIAAVEDYHHKNNRLPISLFELGFDYDEGGPIYYNVDTVENYFEVYFLKGFDLYEKYDSRTKLWTERI